MAYVRKKGNQVAIVQGERDPDTGKVIQKTIFTFFSKAEAYRAIGRGSKDQSHYFQHLLSEEFPSIKFDWKSINKGIQENIDILPDIAEYREQRFKSNFKESLHTFTREIVQADPHYPVTSARLLSEHKDQLLFLRDIIDMKINMIDTTENDFNSDNEFYWRQTLNGWGINGDVEEVASNLYREQDYEAAIAAFTLLTESFPNYAEGHNYLGLIYLSMLDLQKSIHHFKITVELGRKLFPPKIRKDRYWSDLKTRPYMRGLRNLVLALNQDRAYDEALSYCDILEKECGDDITAASYRASAYLNLGKWSLAEDYADRIHQISPLEAVIKAFAQFEQGNQKEARKNFLYATFNYPLAVQMIIQGRAKKPTDYSEAQDYNAGIDTRSAISNYLSRRTAKYKSFFSAILAHPEVIKLIKESTDITDKQLKERDETKYKIIFNRCIEIKSLNFAEEIAKSLNH